MARRSNAAWFLIGGLWLGACAPLPLPGPTPAPSTAPAPSPTPRTYQLVDVTQRDAIAALDQPQFYDARAAAAEYQDSEAVIGISINGASRAYSTAVLERHEIVNDVIGGQKVVVSLSPLSYSAAAYGRVLDGRELTFGSTGQLAMNTPVWYDRQTDSRWSQVTGEAIEGSLRGRRLDFIPVQVTKWGDWRSRHPDTLALVKGTRSLLGPYTAYYRTNEAGVTERVQEDGRLDARDLVLGVVVGEAANAYPYRVLRAKPVVDDRIGGELVLVVFDAANSLAVAYSRRTADGRELTFSQREGTTLVDAETGSTWAGADGRATSGPLKGTQLQPLKSTLMFWFAWKDWYPGAGLYQ